MEFEFSDCGQISKKKRCEGWQMYEKTKDNLKPEKDKLYNSSIQLNNKTKLVLESCVSCLTQLLQLIKEKEKKEEELFNRVAQLSPFFWVDWVGVLKNQKQMEIICYLVSNNAGYLQGFSKVFCENQSNIRARLQSLETLGIIETVPEMEKKTSLYSQKKYFGLYDYHFDKAVFYRLTDLARSFFSGISYDLFLNKWIVDRISSYRLFLRQTHERIEQERSTLEGFREQFYKDFVKHRLGYTHNQNLCWISKRADRINEDPEKLLSEFENKAKKEGGFVND